MSETKPITLYIHPQGPNPKKVIIILEELGIPYTSIPISEPKGEEYTKINPNGRLPAIVDPNTDLTLWESGAIIEYLIEQYDKESKLTFTTFPEKYLLKQYLHFQMSGQGPYFGQAVWFHVFHPEDVPSAKERYIDQVIRVVQVLDKILEGKTYLVGEKCTYADISFIPWNSLVTDGFGGIYEKFEVETKYPNFVAWHKRLNERPAVKKGLGKE
ncbi:Fc.00g090970.m01.CDS01 [Cosmosporella sp. VM-42]